MLALSIQQPWAWLIVSGWKPVENRSWYEADFLGNILVHASKTFDEKGLKSVRQTFPTIPLPHEFKMGGIVGMVEVFGYTRRGRDKWFVGPIGWLLRKPYPLPFVPCRGQLKLFEVNYAQ